MSVMDIQIDIQKMMCYELLKEIGKYKNFYQKYKIILNISLKDKVFIDLFMN